MNVIENYNLFDVETMKSNNKVEVISRAVKSLEKEVAVPDDDTSSKILLAILQETLATARSYQASLTKAVVNLDAYQQGQTLPAERELYDPYALKRSDVNALQAHQERTTANSSEACVNEDSKATGSSDPIAPSSQRSSLVNIPKLDLSDARLALDLTSIGAMMCVICRIIKS